MAQVRHFKSCSDMSSCIQHAREQLTGRIVRCNGRVWFRDETFMWHSAEKEVLRVIANAIEEMHIFAKNYSSVSRNVYHPPNFRRYIPKRCVFWTSQKSGSSYELVLRSRTITVYGTSSAELIQRRFANINSHSQLTGAGR